MSSISLGKRLSALYELVDADNIHFYDLCCDHGHLGLNVSNNLNPFKTTLNDRVKSVCEKLSRLTAHMAKGDVVVLNQDASQIKLDMHTPRFIVIAGVGGPLAIKILEGLKSQLRSEDVLLLSPHTKIHEFRQYLIDENFHLIHEHYCFENGKHYEMLKVTRGFTKKKISIIGDDIWKEWNENKQAYLIEIIKYYQVKLEYTLDLNIKFLLSHLKALKNKNK